MTTNDQMTRCCELHSRPLVKTANPRNKTASQGGPVAVNKQANRGRAYCSNAAHEVATHYRDRQSCHFRIVAPGPRTDGIAVSNVAGLRRADLERTFLPF